MSITRAAGIDAGAYILYSRLCCSTPKTMAAELTEKEAEIYDRQIRLWGVEAQRRMRASRVLISGLNALGTEVAKNIVLAGVSATLHDDTPISETDLGAQFFVRMEHVGTKVSLSPDYIVTSDAPPMLHLHRPWIN